MAPFGTADTGIIAFMMLFISMMVLAEYTNNRFYRLATAGWSIYTMTVATSPISIVVLAGLSGYNLFKAFLY